MQNTKDPKAYTCNIIDVIINDNNNEKKKILIKESTPP